MTLEVSGLDAGYGKRTVLHNIDLRVSEGRICGLLGHNGSGKTTLMNCINMLITPDRGRVTVMGKEISGLDRGQIAQLISVVPQSSFTAFDFSVLDMVLMGSAARMKAWTSPSRKEIKQAQKVLDELGISALSKAAYTRLSGGQQQMVLLSRALYQNTPVMLLDEPNAHLDFCSQHAMMQHIKKVVKLRGVTALVSLHDPNLALYYCDDVMMLKHGRVVVKGPAPSVMTETNLRQALGENISIESTIDGLPVIVPRNLGKCPPETQIGDEEALLGAV
ncbi:MAG: ABC transporter ATP-binding protein [Syntrophomonadaceae bacterium]|nr:ABC transporter ATP-binding protein [Syntrophomonadaceae bacterium]